MGRPTRPSIRMTQHPNAVLSTWSALSNQNADDLSEGGFFYTGNVFYKQKPLYYRNKYFLEEPANMKLFLLQE